ncbi:MAG: M23 family peptidase, partial [Chloroflexota bacterium]
MGRTRSLLGRFAVIALVAGIGLTAPRYEAAGQATPAAPPGVTARTTALLVSSTNDPLRVTGSDGMVHLEYDLVLTNVFTAPVTLESIEVFAPDDRPVHRLSG